MTDQAFVFPFKTFYRPIVIIIIIIIIIIVIMLCSSLYFSLFDNFNKQIYTNNNASHT